jgi:hypothetical protein
MNRRPEPFTATVNVAMILLAPMIFLIVLAIGGLIMFALFLCIGMFATMVLISSTSANMPLAITGNAGRSTET